MNNISLLELLSALSALLSGIALFAYKFPETYKSFKPVKSTFIYGIVFGGGYCIWLKSALKSHEILKSFIDPQKYQKSYEALRGILIDNSSFMYYVLYWLLMLLFFHTLGDLDSFLQKDKNKEEK